MKFIKSFIMVILCLFIASCQKEVSVEYCLLNANEFIEDVSRKTEFYKFESDFNEDVDVFCVLMSVDEEYIASLVDSIVDTKNVKENLKESYKGAVKAVTLNTHDSNFETIEAEIKTIKSGAIEEFFKGTDVLVEYGYVNRNGEVTWY